MQQSGFRQANRWQMGIVRARKAGVNLPKEQNQKPALRYATYDGVIPTILLSSAIMEIVISCQLVKEVARGLAYNRLALTAK